MISVLCTLIGTESRVSNKTGLISTHIEFIILGEYIKLNRQLHDSLMSMTLEAFEICLFRKTAEDTQRS